MSEAGEGDPALGDCDEEPRTPMRRLGSARKLAAFANIRAQLSEQARAVEGRAEAAAAAAGDLADYCRRRAELEHEYARALDKLARRAARRPAVAPGAAPGPAAAALAGARDLARAHGALGAVLAGPLAARLQRAADDAARLHARLRDVLAERQDAALRALADAAAARKAHAHAAAAHRAAALKLRHAYDARQRLLAADPPHAKKLKAIEKQLDKRRSRHVEARGAALRAHADYAVSVEAARAALQRYHADDVAEVLAAAETGWEAVLRRCVAGAAAAQAAVGAAGGAAARALLDAAAALDAGDERARWLGAHAAAPPPVGAPPAPDALPEVLGDAAPPADAALPGELAARRARLAAALRDLRAEAAEHHKTLRAAEAELVRQMEGSESQWELSVLTSGTATAIERDATREQQEEYYLTKFRTYLASAARVARLEAKEAALRRLEEGAGGGGADEDAGDAAEPVPRLVLACVRAVAAHGLRQQGVFRVPGSLGEAAALRAALRRGAGARVRAAPDVHAVCTLLKQELRARPPLAGPARARLLRLAAAPDGPSARARMARELAQLPRRALLTLRHVCAFLHHVAAHARDNLMDAWNLAICVGPALVAAAGDAACHLSQQNLANELVKRLIVHHAELFPQDLAPETLYVPPREEDIPARDENELHGGDLGEAALDELREGPPEPARAPDLDPDLAPDLAPDHLDGHDSLEAPLYTPEEDTDDEDTANEEASEDEDDVEWPDDEPREGGGRRASTLQEAPLPAPAAAAPAPSTRVVESAPDLVLGLPAPPPAAPPSPRPPPAAALAAAAPAATAPALAAAAADAFATNTDTLKRRPAPSADEAGASAAEGAGEEGAGGAGGGPAPARHTARVAAKFADLTLTGGARKPTVAAKPALLRRPTPHPHHAAPAAVTVTVTATVTAAAPPAQTRD